MSTVDNNEITCASKSKLYFCRVLEQEWARARKLGEGKEVSERKLSNKAARLN